MTTDARLFDADGQDRPFDPRDGLPERDDRRLAWIDLDGRSPDELHVAGEALGLSESLLERLGEPDRAPGIMQYPDHVHLSMTTIDPPGERGELDLVAGRDWVLTVHDGPLPSIQRILDGIEGETLLGALDAGGFLAAVVDSAIVGYFGVIEALEREIDRLDEAALASRPREDVLARIVDIRRRIGGVRRTLTRHRGAFAVLDRPDFALHEELGQPWDGLLARFETAVDAVEQLRDALLGTYDIYMGRAAQRDSEVMKILTVLSAVLLPSVVLAGVMGMNFKLDFFDVAANFWFVIGAMAFLAIAVVGVARVRRWF